MSLANSVNSDVRATWESGMFPASEDPRKSQKEEALNGAGSLDKTRIDSQIQDHLRHCRGIKDNVFAAALLFYIKTSIHTKFEDAVNEIISRKEYGVLGSGG